MLVAQNRKPAIDANLFNQVLPRGDYVAQVEASDVIWRKRALSGRERRGFAFADRVPEQMGRLQNDAPVSHLRSRIRGSREREREKAGDLGAAMGVYRFRRSLSTPRHPVHAHGLE